MQKVKDTKKKKKPAKRILVEYKSRKHHWVKAEFIKMIGFSKALIKLTSGELIKHTVNKKFHWGICKKVRKKTDVIRKMSIKSSSTEEMYEVDEEEKVE